MDINSYSVTCKGRQASTTNRQHLYETTATVQKNMSHHDFCPQMHKLQDQLIKSNDELTEVNQLKSQLQNEMLGLKVRHTYCLIYLYSLFVVATRVMSLLVGGLVIRPHDLWCAGLAVHISKTLSS